MSVKQAVIEQDSHGRWHWSVRDGTGREIGRSSKRFGYVRIERAAANLSAIMGVEVELIKVGGVYRRAIIIGRDIRLEVRRAG